MADKYCRRCGKKLVFSTEVIEKRFDEDTGEPVEIKRVVTKCPEFVSGYSDRYYHFHDLRVDGIIAYAEPTDRV